MGVNGYWRFLRSNYKDAIIDNYKLTEVDVVYVDLNSLVHKVITDQMKNEKVMIKKTLDALTYLKDKLNPRDEFHVVCDGIAPIEKLNEMRRRRRTQKHTLRNHITFGTKVFNNLIETLKSTFKDLMVYDFEAFNEGEMKIFEKLKNQSDSKKVAIYSNDSDMINFGMMANAEIVQIKCDDKSFGNAPHFGAVLVSCLRDKIINDFGDVALFMMVCAFHGNDYFEGVAEAPCFEKFKNTLGTEDSIDQRLTKIITKVYPEAEKQDNEDVAEIYAAMRIRSSGRVLNRIILPQPRLLLVKFAYLSTIPSLEASDNDLLSDYYQNPIYQGCFLYGRHFKEYYTSKIKLSSSMKSKLDKTYITQTEFNVIMSELLDH